MEAPTYIIPSSFSSRNRNVHPESDNDFGSDSSYMRYRNKLAQSTPSPNKSDEKAPATPITKQSLLDKENITTPSTVNNEDDYDSRPSPESLSRPPQRSVAWKSEEDSDASSTPARYLSYRNSLAHRLASFQQSPRGSLQENQEQLRSRASTSATADDSAHSASEKVTPTNVVENEMPEQGKNTSVLVQGPASTTLGHDSSQNAVSDIQAGAATQAEPSAAYHPSGVGGRTLSSPGDQATPERIPAGKRTSQSSKNARPTEQFDDDGATLQHDSDSVFFLENSEDFEDYEHATEEYEHATTKTPNMASFQHIMRRSSWGGTTTDLLHGLESTSGQQHDWYSQNAVQKTQSERFHAFPRSASMSNALSSSEWSSQRIASAESQQNQNLTQPKPSRNPKNPTHSRLPGESNVPRSKAKVKGVEAPLSAGRKEDLQSSARRGTSTNVLSNAAIHADVELGGLEVTKVPTRTKKIETWRRDSLARFCWTIFFVLLVGVPLGVGLGISLLSKK